jgi:hypothetical protein
MGQVFSHPKCGSLFGEDYRDDVDFFGVYCHGRKDVYLVPVGDVPLRRASLRLRPARYGQTGVRMAGRYLIRNAETR